MVDAATTAGVMRASPERDLDDLAYSLFAPLIEGRPDSARWEVVSWDAEQGLCLTMRHDDTFLLFELERLDPKQEAWARTSRFNVHVRRVLAAESELSPIERRLAQQVVKVIARREGALPRVTRQATSRRAELREVEVNRVLIPEGAGQYYINPYVGCMIGCDFCYVADRADFSRELVGLPSMPWGRYLDVKVNAAEILAEEVRRFPPGPVRFSPILTDPYQGPERRYGITRQCLEVLLPAGFSPVILTRAARVMQDAELLARFEHAAVGVSIPSDDDRMRAIFEPGGDPIDERFAALEALAAAGLSTFAVIQPLLPMDPGALAARLAPLVRAVRVDRMHFISRVRHLYVAHGLEEAMTDAFFERTQRALLEPLRAAGVGVDGFDLLREVLS